MPAKAKNLSIRSRFNIFANSPKVVKIFGPLLILMLLGAAIYGGYILYNQRYGDAATNNKNTWYRGTKGTQHSYGSKGTYAVTNKQGRSLGKREVWTIDRKLIGNNTNPWVWTGPFKNVTSGRQYLGCFFYVFTTDFGQATIDVVIWNNGIWKVPNSYIIKGSQPKNAGKFNRTCLAFYVPKSLNNNKIELRVHSPSGFGTLHIRKTKLSGITRDNNELFNQWVFKSGPDNSTIINSYGFTD